MQLAGSSVSLRSVTATDDTYLSRVQTLAVACELLLPQLALALKLCELSLLCENLVFSRLQARHLDNPLAEWQSQFSRQIPVMCCCRAIEAWAVERGARVNSGPPLARAPACGSPPDNTEKCPTPRDHHAATPFHRPHTPSTAALHPPALVVEPLRA